jgi:hypothetical protein
MWRDQKNYTTHSRAPKFVFYLLAGIFFVVVFSMVVMWLWNAILPDLIGVHPIRFWQAAGLLVLCRILFGGFPSKRHSKHISKKHTYWRDKWMNMSDDDKVQFKEKWQDWCRKKK